MDESDFGWSEVKSAASCQVLCGFQSSGNAWYLLSFYVFTVIFIIWPNAPCGSGGGVSKAPGPYKPFSQSMSLKF